MPKSEIQDFNQDILAYEASIRKKDFYDDYYTRIANVNAKTVMELGCASGDFLHHMPQQFIGYGVDKSAELIKIANETRKKINLTFICDDVLSPDFSQVADVVVMTGFLCTFMQFELILEKSINAANKLVLINDFMNPFGVDARFTMRNSKFFPKEFQTVYTIWSISTLSEHLDHLGVKYQFIPYVMKSHLNEFLEPVRNFHAILDGDKVIINRAGMILYGYNIIIEK